MSIIAKRSSLLLSSRLGNIESLMVIYRECKLDDNMEIKGFVIADVEVVDEHLLFKLAYQVGSKWRVCWIAIAGPMFGGGKIITWFGQTDHVYEEIDIPTTCHSISYLSPFEAVKTAVKYVVEGVVPDNPMPPGYLQTVTGSEKNCMSVSYKVQGNREKRSTQLVSDLQTKRGELVVASVPDYEWLDPKEHPMQPGWVVKRWNNGNVWAGLYTGNPKMATCDQYYPLPTPKQ